jgi:hypothetical protein
VGASQGYTQHTDVGALAREQQRDRLSQSLGPAGDEGCRIACPR